MISAKDTNMEITKINHILYEESIPVYNLTVDDFHTFLVTKYELLVHNISSPGGSGVVVGPWVVINLRNWWWKSSRIDSLYNKKDEENVRKFE